MLSRVCLVIALAAVACAPAAGQVTDESTVPRISVTDLKKAVDAGRVIVFDVRDAGSYTTGHIPGATLMPLENVGEKAASLKSLKYPIVTYCA